MLAPTYGNSVTAHIAASVTMMIVMMVTVMGCATIPDIEAIGPGPYGIADGVATWPPLPSGDVWHWGLAALTVAIFIFVFILAPAVDEPVLPTIPGHP